jgi:hypothetical protein
VAELMRAGRPVLLDLAGRADLTAAARDWAGRVNVIAATGPGGPADAVLIRPDGYVAWAAGPDAPDGPGTLRQALHAWFGRPARSGAGDVPPRA